MDSTDLKIAIGKRIKNFRLMRNIPQSKLAEIAGVSADTVSRIERGMDVSSDSMLSVFIALDLQGYILDIPLNDIRPIERVRFHGRERQRARNSKQRNPPGLYKFSDETMNALIDGTISSPIDVEGVDTGITLTDVVKSVREGREMDTSERRNLYDLLNLIALDDVHEEIDFTKRNSKFSPDLKTWNEEDDTKWNEK